jgi:Cu(I)/Ag(I) efflux system membrane fusion protein
MPPIANYVPYVVTGNLVVVSGQFLIDSEANLKASTTRMGETAAPIADATHRGQGKVRSIGKEEIIISHGPIAALQWGPMTMGFKLPAAGVPQGITVGGSVEFEFRQRKDGLFEIASIAPAPSGAAKPSDASAKGAVTTPREPAPPGRNP